jgi:hypothetical protein
MDNDTKRLWQLYRAVYTAVVLREQPELFSKEEKHALLPCLRQTQWPLTLDILSNQQLINIVNRWFEENFQTIIKDHFHKSVNFLTVQHELMCVALPNKPDFFSRESITKWMVEALAQQIGPDIDKQSERYLNELKSSIT